FKAFDNDDDKKANPLFRNFKKFLFLRNETLLGKWRSGRLSLASFKLHNPCAFLLKSTPVQSRRGHLAIGLACGLHGLKRLEKRQKTATNIDLVSG
ncbi:MAG: hypothetical protein II494_04730, partial [Bacilli bacterium]|nr:hypothetical protein [Bacilli bacterium]